MPKNTRHKENKISTNDIKVLIPKIHHNQLIEIDLGTKTDYNSVSPRDSLWASVGLIMIKYEIVKIYIARITINNNYKYTNKYVIS